MEVAMFVYRLLLAVLLLGTLPAATRAQPPDQRMKADLLLVVAHPDDETAVGSYLAKAVFDEHRRVAIVYCNRGTGGGNTVGVEQSTSMGLIREIEARQATSSFGISNVWFLNGLDTPGQDVFASLQRFQHGARLEEVVRIIRLTRPEVILTWLPHVVAGENHGDHQASGVIATEAFDLAGDPTVFPAQVTAPRERTDINNATEGLQPWQPKKIYYFSDASHEVAGDGPAFDIGTVSPAKGVPYASLAARLHLPHLTQGDVSEPALAAAASGDDTEFRRWLGKFRLLFGKSVVPCSPTGALFDGVTTAPVPYARPAILPTAMDREARIELGGVFAYYRAFWRAHGLTHLGPLVRPEIEVAVGSYLHVPLLLTNPTADTVTMSLSPELPAGWSPEAGWGSYTLPPGTSLPVQTFIRCPSVATDRPVTIAWKATIKGGLVGSTGLTISLVPWALPQ
jgi:LmbE family N-acetylglucosaminyl deacetylase